MWYIRKASLRPSKSCPHSEPWSMRQMTTAVIYLSKHVLMKVQICAKNEKKSQGNNQSRFRIQMAWKYVTSNNQKIFNQRKQTTVFGRVRGNYKECWLQKMKILYESCRGNCTQLINKHLLTRRPNKTKIFWHPIHKKETANLMVNTKLEIQFQQQCCNYCERECEFTGQNPRVFI